LYALPVAVWAAVLFWLSAQPGAAFEPAGTRVADIPGRNFFVHGALYFVLGGLAWFWAWAGLRISRCHALAVAVGLAVLYGVSDEWHQSFVPGRSPDALDVLADGLGAAVAGTVLWFVGGLRKEESNSQPGDEDAGR
jgi:hypothetical protein